MQQPRQTAQKGRFHSSWNKMQSGFDEERVTFPKTNFGLGQMPLGPAQAC
jgi:hypothetical protein